MPALERKRRSRPLSGRKAGRKPIGPIAMTSAERARKHRREEQLIALAPHERSTGAGQPLPQGQPAPVAILQKDIEP